jgi:hypothetical protein
MSNDDLPEFQTIRPRWRGLPRLSLRQRSQDHPMAMFFLIVATAFAAAALISPSGAALASLGTPSVQPLGTAGQTARLMSSETDVACRGQAWGSESQACLAVIAREAGRDGAKIRLIVAGNGQSLPSAVF